MRNFLALQVIVVALSAAAHASPSWPAACGKDEVQFKVKTDKKKLPEAPEAGRAQIVFIEALDGDFMSVPTARFAIDGVWTGATRGPSYFALAVAPGKHEICGSRQSSAKLDKENRGTVSVNAEAGKTYFLEFKITRTAVGPLATGASIPGNPANANMTAKEQPTIDSATFRPLEEDAARQRMKTLPTSTFTQKN